MVYGGSFFGLFALSVAIGRGDFFLGVAALLLFAVAFYFVPFVRKSDPAIVASSAGLKVSGLGLVRWDAIGEAMLIDKAVRTIRNTELHLALKCPLEQALVTSDYGPLARRFMVQIWQAKKNQLIIKLEPLDVKPEPILETVRAFLSHH